MTPSPLQSSPAFAWRTVHEAEFHRVLARLPDRTLVLFGQAGCSACRRAEAVIPPALVESVQHFVKIDAAEQAALAREFEVFHLPALHLFIDGRYHAPLSCELTTAGLRDAVSAAAAAPAVEAP